MIDALKKRNLDSYSDSRPLEPEDFQNFDYIINMNDENNQEVQKAAQYWKDNLQKSIPSNWKDKVNGQLHYGCNLHIHGRSGRLELACITCVIQHQATAILQQACSVSLSCSSIYTSTCSLMHERQSSQMNSEMSYKIGLGFSIIMSLSPTLSSSIDFEV